MLTDYHDIIKKAGTPYWYDEYGVPRYCLFEPQRCGVYISAAALIIVECQSCDEQFKVASTWDPTNRFMELISQNLDKGKDAWGTTIQKEINYESIPGIGDPPRHDCPGGGETMSSDTTAIIELWIQKDFEWVRLYETERKMNRELQGLEQEEEDER